MLLSSASTRRTCRRICTNRVRNLYHRTTAGAPASNKRLVFLDNVHNNTPAPPQPGQHEILHNLKGAVFYLIRNNSPMAHAQTMAAAHMHRAQKAELVKWSSLGIAHSSFASFQSFHIYFLDDPYLFCLLPITLPSAQCSPSVSFLFPCSHSSGARLILRPIPDLSDQFNYSSRQSGCILYIHNLVNNSCRSWSMCTSVAHAFRPHQFDAKQLISEHKRTLLQASGKKSLHTNGIRNPSVYALFVDGFDCASAYNTCASELHMQLFPGQPDNSLTHTLPDKNRPTLNGLGMD